MNQKEPILEAEVVEIDGVAVEPSPEVDESNKQQSRKIDWQSWQGKIRVLDRRWMPLWIVLGVIAITLIVIVGFLFAIVALVFWMVKTILRAVFSMFTGADQSISR